MPRFAGDPDDAAPSAASRPRWRIPRVTAPGIVHPAVVRISKWFLLPLMRLMHRPSIRGWENLPDGPFLLVANHSAGLALSELHSFAALYLEKYGASRPLAGFAHPVGFTVFPISLGHKLLGSIPSTYEAAEEALCAGVPLLVFPGGDHETLRPVWQARRVDFGGRKGFLKIARKMRAPIVPMGIAGSHITAPILWRSKGFLPRILVLPWLLGMKRWAVTALGIVVPGLILAAPVNWWIKPLAIWAWLASPFIFLPVIPATIRMAIGEPIPPDQLFDGGEGELDRALDQVQSAVQSLVDGL
ncbi:MAG: hypothetical protein GMKNLPBB_00900 [Myxococcota bacterium]|nr:hypothetical protein [Myxococcota bacterium]